MRLGMTGLMLVAFVSAAQTAAADETALLVDRPTGTETCPDADSIRAQVAKRLGRDPFAAESGTFAITFERVDDGFIARVVVSTGDSRSSERVIGPSRRCSTTARALVLALAVMLEQRDVSVVVPAPAPASAPDPEPNPDPVPTTPTPRSPSPGFAPDPDDAADLDPEIPPLGPRRTVPTVIRRSPRLPITVRLAVGAGLSSGLLPGANSTRLGWELSFRRGSYSALLAAHGDLGDSYEIAGGSVTTQLFAGTGGFCVHGPLLVGCLLASAGALVSDGDGFTTPASPVTAYAAGGMRLGLEIPLVGGALFAKIHIDLLGTLVRSRLQVEGTPEGSWTAPGGSMSGGVLVQARLW